MSYKCTVGGCGQEMADEAAPFHGLAHKIDGLNETMKANITALSGNLEKALGGVLSSNVNALSGKLDEIGKRTVQPAPEHVKADDVLAHAESCPTCKVTMERIKDLGRSEVKAAYEKQAAGLPKPPAQEPKKPAPKPIIWQSEAEIPGSPFSQRHAGLSRTTTDKGAVLVADTEEAGTRAVQNGLAPHCRWVKNESGAGYLACEPE